MKLLVLGATGATGRHIVRRALDSGDTVTVLARRPGRLGGLSDRVTVFAGDATHTSDVTRAMAHQDATISALGTGKSVRAGGLFTRAAAAVVGAAGETGVSRLIWLSSFGVGDTYRSADVALKAIYGSLLRDIYADKEASENTIRSSGLDWTLVYPTTLTNGPAKGTYRVEDGGKMKFSARISRADVAEFMHKAAHSPEWAGRRAVITD